MLSDSSPESRTAPPQCGGRPLRPVWARRLTAPELAPPAAADAPAAPGIEWRAAIAESASRTTRERANAALPVEIGFLLHRAGFGGAERVACAVAGRTKAAGMRPRLYLCGPAAGPAPAFADIFASVETLDMTDRAAALDALSGLDAILATQVDAAPSLFAALRARGVVTAAHIHLVDRTAFERDAGFMRATLDHIAETDLIFAASRDIAERLAALGAPPAKIAILENAPGFPLAPAEAAASLAARRERLLGGAPLRALYLGRLDWQKGLGALDGLVRATTREGAAPRLDWRIVGDEVLGGDAPAALARRAEPPVMEAAALQALYDWADILVLSSLYEGAPLVLLEAMRAGAIPVATAVGAVPELVEDGASGVLLRPGRALADGLAALARLDADRPAAATMARAAHRRMAGRDWIATAAGPLAALRRLAEGAA